VQETATVQHDREGEMYEGVAEVAAFVSCVYFQRDESHILGMSDNTPYTVLLQVRNILSLVLVQLSVRECLQDESGAEETDSKTVDEANVLGRCMPGLAGQGAERDREW